MNTEILDNVVDLYIRVSTQEQAQEGFSVGEQEAKLRAYCQAYNYIINAVHIDPGFSGATLERPAIQQVVKDVKRGTVKKVIVWKLDRLSRSQKDTLILLEDVFLENDCAFISLMESFDTGTPFGRCIVGILAAFAQMERENIRMRTMMGIQAGLKAGNFYAPYAPVGYKFSRDADGHKYLDVDEFFSPMIKELYRRLDAGESLGSIAESFKATYGYSRKYKNDTATQLSRIARNKVYCGRVEHGANVYQGKHTPLVSEELWDRVNMRLSENKKAFQRMYTGSDGLCSGLLFCGCCGARMSIRGWGYKEHKVNKYICYSVSKCSKRMIKDPDCINRKNHFAVSDLDQLILDEIKKLALDRSAFDAYVDNAEEEQPEHDIDLYRDKLAGIDRQINRLLNLYQSGFTELEEIQDRLTDLKEERSAISDMIEGLEVENEGVLSPDRAWDMVCSLQSVIDNGDADALYSLVHTLIEKIVILNGDVTIHWAFC